MSTSRVGFFSQSMDYLYRSIGGHFPYHAYVSGYPVIGKFWDLFCKDGRGFDRIITEATKIAEENQGIAWWRFGPFKDAALILTPENIREIIKDNNENLVLHDSTGSFKMFFGPESIFNSEVYSERWKQLRNRFIDMLLAEKTLRNDITHMQHVLDKHMALLQHAQIDNLEQFCNSITMDMIGIKIGLIKLQEEDKARISALLAKGVVEVANPWNQVIAPYIPGYRFEETNLYKIMQEGYVVLRKMIKENEEYIRSTNNWLHAEGEESKDYFTQDVLYNVTQFLVAGHETTSKLLLFTLTLLADPKHAHVLTRLREEIAAQEFPPEEWTRDTIKKMPYLEAIMNEILRLYPPIPDMIFKIDKGFSIANGEYTFKSADLAIISPRATGHSKMVWGDDAEEFKPERMLAFADNKNEMSDYTHFPFGFMPRQCVGRMFSKQEVALTVARLFNRFDVSLQTKDGNQVQHPVPFYQIFTLHVGLHDIQARLIPYETPRQRFGLVA